MQVLQVSQFYPPHTGGIERAVKSLSTGLADRDVDVTVLAATDAGPAGTGVEEGVTVHRLTNLGTAGSVPVAPALPVRLRQYAADADLIHVHLPHPSGVLSHQLHAPRDVPVVVTYHSDIVRQELALTAYAPVLRRFLRRADTLLTTSPRLRDNSEFLAPHRDRTRVVPLSIDADVFVREPSPVDLPGSPDRPTLLFVGRLVYYKGVEYLLDSAPDVEADLLVVGTGDRRERLERRARDNGVADRTNFLGYVDEETLHACYAAADLFVLPSVAPTEAFGIVQLEAMAYGLPVVNTSLPTGVPWVSRDGETGLTVPPRDTEALATALSTLLSDPDRRERMGRRAEQRVRPVFGRDEMIDDVLDCYRRTIR